MGFGDFRKCSICGTMFDFNGKPYCGRCALSLEEAFVLVRDFLDENPGVDMVKILDGTGVSEKLIMQLVKEGRLAELDHLKQGRGSQKRCMMCQKPILEGNMCRECSIKTASALSGNTASQTDISKKKLGDSKKTGQRMYTRDDVD